MNRKAYVEQRKALVAEAEAYVNEGSQEKFLAKKAEIEALDQQYEEAAKARANARAMREQLADLSGRQLDGDDTDPTAGRVIDGTGRPAPTGSRWDLSPSADRGRELRALNAVQLTSTGVIVPRRYGSEIQPTFNEVSSLIDRVRVLPRLGGESFEQSYVKSYAEAAEVADNADYAAGDVIFGFARMAKSKVTIYSELDEGVLKLPDADYDSEVTAGVRIAMRKRLTRQILIGNGAANRLTGIFASSYAAADPEKGAIDPATDLALAAVDDDTLDELIFGYGGEEDVEDGAVLILNKHDLKAFAQLRDGNGNRVHTIRYNGNTGNIDGVQFIVNSACKALAAGAAGDYAMAYGHLSGYGLAIFSDMDIQRSTDYKFRSGQVAHRGSVYAGGNVVRWNGFLRVKKKAAG